MNGKRVSSSDASKHDEDHSKYSGDSKYASSVEQGNKQGITSNLRVEFVKYVGNVWNVCDMCEMLVQFGKCVWVWNASKPRMQTRRPTAASLLAAKKKLKRYLKED